MAEADTTAAPAQQSNKLTTTNDVSARLQQVLALLFPSNLAAKAALFAAVVALLPLLPTSQVPRLWELPHLLLLGIIISYGVFGQKNADAEVAAAVPTTIKPVDDVEAYVSEMMQGSSFAFEQNDDRDDDGGAKDDVQSWSAQYLPDDPLVVVADDGKGVASEKPLHLPVRKLNPAAEEESAKLTSDGIDDEEEEDELREFLAPKAAGYDNIVRDRAIPSPSSVLDADLMLSPSSPPLLPPPPPPPFLATTGRSRLQKAKARSFNEFGVGERRMSGIRLGLPRSAGNNKQQFRSKSAVHARRSAAFTGYDPGSPIGYEGGDGEIDDMVATGVASESSFSSDDMLLDDDNGDKEEESYGEEEDDDDGDSCDEELFELATRQSPEADDEVEEVGDEVDRKAEEFIAKFRDQIRMQRTDQLARR